MRPPVTSTTSEPGPSALDTDRTSARNDPQGGLSAMSRRIAWSAAQAILCDEDESSPGTLIAPPPAVCDRAVRGLDESLARSSADLRRGFWVLTVALEFLPLFILGVPSRMTRLTLEQRLAYLEALENHRIGLLSMLLIAFKVPLCVPAFEEGEELRSTGFDRQTLSTRRLLVTSSPRREAA
ncbi:hypothetical protein [Chondromyces crocatus]|uniref:Uncharacterized protein n=1 Tax=Chondromyces crocatus TaxID=52 RepID=A0A0K1EFD1_CHOCO|nr:hypothetical protein [Chondromyces crocatus]AKT39412.1 uncharacterized protein CMC5_035590 [Chondromyces crocatus]